MMVVTVASGAAQCLRKILQIRKLAGLGSAGEIVRKLIELVRGGGIALGFGCLSGILQVCGDLSGHFRVLGRIRLLQILQCAGQLRKGRKLAAVRLNGRCRFGPAGCVHVNSGVFDRVRDRLIKIRIAGKTDWACAHKDHIGISVENLNWIVQNK